MLSATGFCPGFINPESGYAIGKGYDGVQIVQRVLYRLNLTW